MDEGQVQETTAEEFQSYMFTLIISFYKSRAEKVGEDRAKLEIKEYISSLMSAFD